MPTTALHALEITSYKIVNVFQHAVDYSSEILITNNVQIALKLVEVVIQIL